MPPLIWGVWMKLRRPMKNGIRRARALGDLRGAAVAKFQLGTVRLLQKRYKEALEIYAEARDAFEALGEPRQVATVWHQIGMVHQEAGQFEPAEQAYRQSLAIKVRENDLAGQAASSEPTGQPLRQDGPAGGGGDVLQASG